MGTGVIQLRSVGPAALASCTPLQPGICCHEYCERTCETRAMLTCFPNSLRFRAMQPHWHTAASTGHSSKVLLLIAMGIASIDLISLSHSETGEAPAGRERTAKSNQ